ncbi:RNA pyrophosphohydrolase [Sphingorhabdus arenilitoris]|uniref:RNA pyrophosphohydrolase n=1 Tax=Sphingorhabdus arenilitoris TaxID=1490041 RepID=A0ABV8RFD8_9SPHN
MADFDSLPYRPCAGIMLANENGQIFVGRRIDNPGSEAWQMPQGGIDDGETADDAAIRELQEETGIAPALVDVIARTKEEYYYDLPPELIGKLWQGRWRGQRQYWFLMRFRGNDADINIKTRHPEFSAWKWSEPDMVPKLIVPFKRHLYERVIAEFLDLI